MKRIKVYSVILLIIFVAVNIFNTPMSKSVQAYERKTIQYTKDENNQKDNFTSELRPQIAINTADVLKNGKNNIVKVWGYAVNKAGIKEVRTYLDDKYLGTATIGLARNDVAWKFKEYPDGNKSGYLAQLNIPAGIGTGDKTLKVVAVGKDGTSDTVTKTVSIKSISKVELKPQTAVNTADIIKNNNSNMLKVWGYAVSKSGIREVKVYLDNKCLGLATTGLTRNDMAWKFKEYPDGSKSGYLAQLNIPVSIGAGDKTLKVIAIGKDGTSDTVIKTVSIKADTKVELKPQTAINTADVLKNGKNNMIKVWGYAVNKSGIKEVRAYLDNKYIGSATISLARNDVAWKFKEYPGGSKSGYLAQLNIPDSVGSGNKTLKIVAIGKDGTSDTVTKAILIKGTQKVDLKPQTSVSTVNIIKNDNNNNMIKIWGYAVNPSGIKEVKIYIADRFIGMATTGLTRSDVAWKFKSYPNGDKSGFLAQLSVPASIGAGSKVLKVIAVGNNGSVDRVTLNVTVNRKLVVIDPGHLGHDTGTVINGCVESQLNGQVAVKLQQQLESLGYNVELTRSLLRPNEFSYLSVDDELRQRYNMANGLKPDLFISIHHNSIDATVSKQQCVSGIAAYYSTWKPGIKNVKADLVNLTSGYTGKADIKPTEAAKIGKKFAEVTQDTLARECKYNKGECVDRNLAVTVHTNMPSALFELGFICNKKEAVRCADPNEQMKKAKVIAKMVKSMF